MVDQMLAGEPTATARAIMAARRRAWEDWERVFGLADTRRTPLCARGRSKNTAFLLEGRTSLPRRAIRPHATAADSFRTCDRHKRPATTVQLHRSVSQRIAWGDGDQKTVRTCAGKTF